MAKWIFKISRHSLKMLLRTTEVLLALLIISVGLIFWRLSVEPMNVDFLTPKLIERFVPKEAGIIVDVRSVTLSARVEEDGLFHLQIKDLSVLRPDGAVITDLPEIEMSYGLWRILTLNYMPDTLTIVDPLLQATIDKEGNFYLQNKKSIAPTEVSVPLENQEHPQALEAQGAAVPSAQETSAFLISDVDGALKYLLAFKRLELENAQVILDNQQHQRQYSIPSLNLLLEQVSVNEYLLEADASISVQDGKGAHLSTKVLMNQNTKEVSWEVNFDSLYLPRLAMYVPVLEDAKMSLKGVVLGKMNLSKGKHDFRKSIQELSFKIQEEKQGTVNLPAPLTNLYTVKSLLVQGAFSAGLESLKINQSSLSTGGETVASLAVDIAGLGAFLDTKDLSQIKTVLKSTVKNVKTEEVPNLWPSSLGPDAHAWVKKNLSNGSISTADFTLYFTGDNLDDLFGDVKASGISVRYLDEMPQVHEVVARVYLHPETVEIFATAGKLDGITLNKADLYLTELQDKVSHAKVILNATGPVQDVMKVIDSKPLEFAKDFGIDPLKTGGNGTVTATLIFPLIETLDANQVKVNVNAKITDGVFPTPIPNVSVKEGAFDLAINNAQLTLEGNAKMEGLPLTLSWNEYFKQTKKNTTKSHYHIQGAISENNLKKWMPSVNDYLTGEAPFVVDVRNNFKGSSDINAQINMTKTKVELYPISVTKEVGAEASLNVKATFDSKKMPTIFAFDLQAPKMPMSIKGKLDMTQGFSFIMDQVEAPNNSFAGRIVIKPKDTEIVLKGKSWNLTRLFDMPFFKKEEKELKEEKPKTYAKSYVPPSNIFVDVDMNSVTLVEKKPFRRLQVKGVRKGPRWQSLNVLLRASDDLIVTYIPQSGQLRGETNNLGDLLSRAGFTNRFFGGQLRLAAVQSPQGVFKGDINVRSFALKDPGFLIQAFTVLGIVDGIRGKELSFNRAYVPFEFTPQNTLKIHDGYTNGTTIGVTFKGTAAVSELNLAGSVIPAYAINSLPGRIPLIGGLFKDGTGGGLMGVRYDLKGTLLNPITTFNALSSIAPGILGNLFSDL